MDKQPISESSTKPYSKGCGVLFGMPFLIIGLVFLWFILIQPLQLWQRSAGWPTVNGRITNAEIVESHSDDGTSYRCELTYAYEVGGKKFVNNRFGLVDGSGSRKSAVKVMKAHPIGSKIKVYYDSNQPQESLINRELSWWMLFSIIPIVFVLIGGFIIYTSLVGDKPKRLGHDPVSGKLTLTTNKSSLDQSTVSGQKREYLFEADKIDEEFDQPLKLKPAQGRLSTLLVAIFFGAFWNGIVSVFVFQVIRSFQKGDGDWFGAFFMIPFVVIGVCIVGFCIYSFLALFNPRIEIAMSCGLVPIGGTVDLAWEIVGNANRFRKLTIEIEGSEEATYQRGTSTYTDENVFHTIPVMETKVVDEMRFGSRTISVPEQTMHSMDLGDNKINWQVQVHGDIPWWPDVYETLEFRVKP